MPTYEYACTSCGERLEVVQRFSDEPLTECPSCHGQLRKVFSPVGVVFKGGGFYKTDSRSSGRSSSTTKPDAATSEPAKSEPAKPAAPASGSTGGDGGSGSSKGDSKVA